MKKDPLQPFRSYLSDAELKLCQQALDIMEHSHDPYHDIGHVERMLQDFSYLLRRSAKLAQVLSPNVVVLSVCWHDSWKAGRVGKNTLQLFFHQLWDGMGSAVLFEKAAKEIGLEKPLRQQVYYAIRKHAQFQFLPVMTLEAKVLRDLDDLELLSHERWEKGKHIFALAARWRAKIFRHELLTHKLYTDWGVEQQRLRRPPFLEVLNQHIQDLR